MTIEDMTDSGHIHHAIDYIEFVVLYSNDLETTLTKVREAGGRITREPFGFPGGRRFHFQDPSGNELAVWSEK